MSERRPLGTGPVPADIRAREADLSAELPGERWADIEQLRAAGLFGVPTGNGPELPRAAGGGTEGRG
ncbi:hypothetical protein AB0H45_35145 [Streptomyces atroolivaceus]|uniref:hypothetical protein n=1 Tax=Streptomyces atroolivaceus TaxID=66869 RepID=UPI0033DF28CB